MSYKFNDLTVYYVGGPESPIKSKESAPVRYEDIRAKYNKDHLYEDPDFPAVFDSIGQFPSDEDDTDQVVGGQKNPSYIWCRPKEICATLRIPKPDFAVVQKLRDGTELNMGLISEDDVMQGGLGDCWYLSALAGMTKKPEHVKIVIPDDNLNGFDEDKYCGAFHFRFYSLEESKWVDIVVDDRLPCTKDKRTAFTRVSLGGTKTTEFWPALIEKAYAKFIGSYAKIYGGFSADALENLTNGFGQILMLDADLPNYGLAGLESVSKYDRIKAMILGSLEKGHFLCLGTYPSPQKAGEHNASAGYTRLGLINRHAYSILDGQSLKTNDGSHSVFLVKIRNPHAQTEWKGEYSDADDAHWNLLEKDLRTKNISGSKVIEEGTFWMELADVIRYFEDIEVCMYGMKDSYFTSIKSEWPADIQNLKPAMLMPKHYPNFNAFKFEVKQGSGSKERQGMVGSNCLLAFQIVIHGHNALSTGKPNFTVVFYEVKENIFNPSDLLNTVYLKSSPKLKGLHDTGRSLSVVTTIKPGSYIMIPILETTTRDNKPPIPAEMQGKSIPFTIRLYTENKTEITPFAPQI